MWPYYLSYDLGRSPIFFVVIFLPISFITCPPFESFARAILSRGSLLEGRAIIAYLGGGGYIEGGRGGDREGSSLLMS